MPLFSCDVLLVTVTDIETETVLAMAKEYTDSEPELVEGTNIYYRLGRIGKNDVGLVESEMG